MAGIDLSKVKPEPGPNDPRVTVRPFPKSGTFWSELTAKFRNGEISKEDVECQMKEAEEAYYQTKEISGSAAKQLPGK